MCVCVCVHACSYIYLSYWFFLILCTFYITRTKLFELGFLWGSLSWRKLILTLLEIISYLYWRPCRISPVHVDMPTDVIIILILFGRAWCWSFTSVCSCYACKPMSSNILSGILSLTTFLLPFLWLSLNLRCKTLVACITVGLDNPNSFFL